MGVLGRLWSFGLFPVVAAAAFQIGAIYRSQADLAQFFFAQSAIALGISVTSLQPRSWHRSKRTVDRVRWSLVFNLLFLVACVIALFVRPPQLFDVLVIFLIKKVCDAMREFFFLAEVKFRGLGLIAASLLEAAGIVFIFLDLRPWSMAAYALAAGVLATAVMLLTRMVPISRPVWAPGEVFNTIGVTLFNMGSRLFMVATPENAARVAIGALLQALNFVSPLNYTINSRKHRFLIKGFATALVALITALGAVGLIYLGGESISLWPILGLAALVVVNSALAINFMNTRSEQAKRRLSAVVSVWVLLAAGCALVSPLAWELNFVGFLLGSIIIVLLFHRTTGELVESA